MLAELVDHVVGVDPDRDWITLAVLEAGNAGVVAEGRFAATADGYQEAVVFVDGHRVETERAWVIEGSAGYGRGLAVALARRGERLRNALTHGESQIAMLFSATARSFRMRWVSGS